MSASQASSPLKVMTSYMTALTAKWIESRVTEMERAAAKIGEQLGSPWLHRVKGELLAQNPSDGAKAEPCFRTAIEIARRQSARSPELRATTSLARLLNEQGRRDEARTMLAEIYGWFTEGFDTPDLKDAKALLDELQG